MALIVVSEFMDEQAVDRLRAGHEVVYDPALVDDGDRLQRLAGTAAALIVRNRTQVRGALLDVAKELSCIGRLGVGLDNIDVAACAERNINVYPATGANDLAVAEYVITATLLLLRGSWLSTPAMLEGRWPRQAMIGREAAGKVMGLVGYGAIARQVAARAGDLGMTCIGYDPYLQPLDPAWGRTTPVPLTELLGTADVVSLHTPLTAETRNLVDADALAAMKPSAILVNAARGGIVDEQALADALSRGHLAGAALDVFETEPLGVEAARRFSGLPNLILTPHIAGVTEESNVRVSNLIAERVLADLGSRR